MNLERFPKAARVLDEFTVLDRLRAHVAAHPSDVAVISEVVRQDAEAEAYRALAELARKWRRRNGGTRLPRALARAAINSALDKAMGGTGDPRNPWSQTPTVVGMPRPMFDEEPFPLSRIPARKLAPIRKRIVHRPAWYGLVRAVQRACRNRLRRNDERVGYQGSAGSVVTLPSHE